jgi:peptide/nickel transport system permease protein
VELIATKLPVTLELAIFSMLIALSIGVPLGIIAATRKDSPIGLVANLLALSGISLPHFWLGIMMILIFSVNLGWLPSSGFVPITEDWKQNLTSLIMPSFVLGSGVAGVITRHTRGAMLQVLSSDYVRTARAKGLTERVVVNKHALRNALMPVITLSTIEFGRLLSGAVLTEQIFSIPGFGKLIVDAVFNRDYQVIQGVVLVAATLYILLNFVADILYYAVNPRLRG